jgi:hypothetical protein
MTTPATDPTHAPDLTTPDAVFAAAGAAAPDPTHDPAPDDQTRPLYEIGLAALDAQAAALEASALGIVAQARALRMAVALAGAGVDVNMAEATAQAAGAPHAPRTSHAVPPTRRPTSGAVPNRPTPAAAPPATFD